MENVYSILSKRAVFKTADEIKIANFKTFRQIRDKWKHTIS